MQCLPQSLVTNSIERQPHWRTNFVLALSDFAMVTVFYSPLTQLVLYCHLINFFGYTMRYCFILLTVCIGFVTLTAQQSLPAQKPRVCLSFDDGSIDAMPGYTQVKWNQLLLNNLGRAGKQAIFFVAGKPLDNPAGRQLLRAWDQAGHLLANHTYSHLYYHGATVTFEQFAQDCLRNDSLLRGYTHFTPLFRFPYLKEGDTRDKRDRFRKWLANQGYRNGYVTIDDSDWYVNSRLVKRLKQTPRAEVAPYQAFYLKHILDRATYYNRLSQELTGRPIAHTLLLHHNLTSALFVDDLIRHFEASGWEVINASEAYRDPIYQHAPQTLPAGESLVWAMARETGRYDDQLRYPAEDSRYEEAEMNRLGL